MRLTIKIRKIGLRLTFQPPSVFLILKRAIIAAIIVVTRTLRLVEDTYQEVGGVIDNHFISPSSSLGTLNHN